MKKPIEYPFIASLEKLRDEKDRASLAKLRRGLGKKMGTPEMYPYVVPYLPNFPKEQAHYFLVASLFAIHPVESPKGISMGKVFKRIWEENDRSDSLEKRFTNLLAADAEDIGGPLRHIVSLSKSRNVPIDYHRLLYDLKNWEHHDRFVQLNWARDFWRTEKQEDTDKQKKGEVS
jgi:CRISPR system Cascade subunit CasB